MDRRILSAASVQDLADQFGTVLSLATGELSTADLAGIERRVQQVGQQVFGRVVEAVVATRAAAAAPGERVCPRCAQPLRLVDAARARHLQGLVGEYALVRAYYHCATCSQGDAPLDAELGLGPGALSPGLSRVACRLGIAEAFAPAAEVLWETLQVAVPAESVRRITEGLGAVAEAEQQAALAQARGGADPPLPAEPPAQLVVAVDGVMVHSDGDWHEMKVGVVAPLGPGTWTDPDSGRVGQTLGPQSVCAGLEAAAAFWWRLYCEARRRGLGTAPVALVVVLGDGADWIWHAAARFLALRDVELVEIVDIYHAWEHLWTVGNAVFGTGSAAAAAWVTPLKRRLEQDGVDITAQLVVYP